MSLEPAAGGEDVSAQNENKSALIVSIVAIAGAFLIMAAMVWLVSQYVRPAPVDQTRAESRRRELDQLRRTSLEQLGGYGFVDAPKGQVRLPIERAMELMIQQGKNPEMARSNLLARVDKFNPPPPPPAPAEPSPFE